MACDVLPVAMFSFSSVHLFVVHVNITAFHHCPKWERSQKEGNLDKFEISVKELPSAGEILICEKALDQLITSSSQWANSSNFFSLRHNSWLAYCPDWKTSTKKNPSKPPLKDWQRFSFKMCPLCQIQIFCKEELESSCLPLSMRGRVVNAQSPPSSVHTK